jgi:hypothetical protein
MIAINWFEVLLPSTVFEIPAERLEEASFKITEQSLEKLKSEGVPDDVVEKLESIKNQESTAEEEFIGVLKTTVGEEQTVRFKSLILKHALEDVPKRKKSIEHRTVLRSTDETRILYHITASPPDGIDMEEVNLEDDPSIAKYIIEHGFAVQLREAGFEVWLKHVGGVGYHSVDNSARPTIYRSMEGIKFRCFYGFNRGEPLRWGLILSYATRQYFNISLRDTHLRQLALGNRVVPLNVVGDETTDKDSSDIGQWSAILESVQKGEAILIDRDGNRHTVSLNEWTLPCRLDNLLGYIRSVEGPNSASEVAIKLQQEALTLTSERRMNTALARDQLEKLRTLMAETDLFALGAFHLS